MLGLLTVKAGDKSPIKTASASVSSSSAVSEKIVWEEGVDKHHVLEGSRGGHIEGWNKMGFNPKDKNTWNLLLPIMQYVVDNYDSVESKIVDGGNRVMYYTKEFAEVGVTVVVKICVSVDGLIQKLSDAWPIIN